MRFSKGIRAGLASLSLAVVALSGPPAAAATLTGDAVVATYEFGSTTYTTDVTVGAGVEITCPGAPAVCTALPTGEVSLDFGANTISFTQDAGDIPALNYSNLPFNGWKFSGLDFGAGIGSVSLGSFGFLDADGDETDIDLSRLLFTDSTISFNLSGLVVATQSGWTLTLTEKDMAPVPLPAGLPLALAGLGALALLRRRRV